MTKITILGQEQQKKKLKPIEFVAYLMVNCTSEPNTHILACHQPHCFETIEVIPKKRDYRHDLFLCTMKNGDYYIMIGHLNDGVVK